MTENRTPEELNYLVDLLGKAVLDLHERVTELEDEAYVNSPEVQAAIAKSLEQMRNGDVREL